MNILPLVSAFILIFSIGSLALLRHCKAAFVEKEDCHAAYFIERALYNDISDKKFKNEKKKCAKAGNTDSSNHSENTESSDNSENKKEKEYESFRSELPPSNYGKLNIFELCKKDVPNPELEKIALKLIRNIYEYTSIYHKGLEEIVLKTLVEAAKANPTVTAFEDLYLYIPKEHQELFYKILNGTSSYQLRTTRGFPPLRDFLIISSKETHYPIHLLKASEMVLIAAFDEAITRKIMQQEREKGEKGKKTYKAKALTKEELNNLFFQEGIQLTNLGENLFSLSSKSYGNPEQIYRDEKTHKVIRWNKQNQKKKK